MSNDNRNNPFLRSEIVLYVLLSLLCYLMLNAMLPAALLIQLLNAAFFGVSVAVLLSLLPLVMRAISHAQFDRISQLSVGIAISWFAIVIMHLNVVLWRSLNHPHWLFNSPLTSFASFLAIIGGILYIAAPGLLNVRDKQNRGILVFSVVTGIILAIFIFSLQTQHG